MFKYFFQLNNTITYYVCVQLIKFIYYIFICMCFVSNKVLLKVKPIKSMIFCLTNMRS